MTYILSVSLGLAVTYLIVFHFRVFMVIVFACISFLLLKNSTSFYGFLYNMLQLGVVSMFGVVFFFMAKHQYASEIDHYNYLVEINRNAGAGSIMLAKLLGADVVYEPDPFKIYGLWAIGWFIMSVVVLFAMNQA